MEQVEGIYSSEEIWGLDVSSELEQLLSEELAKAIDKQIIENIFKLDKIGKEMFVKGIKVIYDRNRKSSC